MSFSGKTTLFFKQIGQDKEKNLVFVHGLLGFWRNFYSISKTLEQEYHCLLYDQRGHGSSPQSSSYRLEDFAQDLKNLILELKLKPVFLVGHSLGGYVASYLAFKEPALVEKLVLVDSCPWPKKEKAEEIIQLLKGLPSGFSNRESAKSFFKGLVRDKKISSTMSFFLMANLEKNQTGPVSFVFDKQGLESLPREIRKHDYSVFLKSFHRPILSLRGEFSAHYLKSDLEKTKAISPFIQTMEIPASSHWLHAQQPEAFIKALRTFLNS